MREVKFRIDRKRYVLPVAILRPGAPNDLEYFTATALLDTGATVSGIGPRVIEGLNLQSYGKSRLKSATEEAFVAYYLFRLGLFTTEQVEMIGMQTSDLPFLFDELNGFSWGRASDFDVILGMDVLSQCDIAIKRNGICAIVFG
jgi:predicted aspartyl protease